jgi:DNA-binding NtrC family response regulator/tetratricopeptide (TPR) repeat protein
MARKKRPETVRAGDRGSVSDNQADNSTHFLRDVEALYRAGLCAEVLSNTDDNMLNSLGSSERLQAFLVRGMALFDLGDAVGSLELLEKVVGESRQHRSDLQFTATFALFVRATDFLAPSALLPVLVNLRQLAAQIGDAPSLAGLHLAVARLEGLRGHCVDAHRHLEIARRLADRSMRLALRCSVDLVEASLESVAGNLVRCRQLAEACFRLAETEGYAKYKLGSATNLAVVALYGGNVERAQQCLDYVLASADSITYVKLGALDNLATLELHKGNLRRCSELLQQCRDVTLRDRLPSRSWYDFAHDLTRCAYFERLEDWSEIIAIADLADAELARRQYKAIRTSLLCAKARALARIGRRADAEAALAMAVRVCPRGAVDPLIVLEASKAVTFALRGDLSRGDVHFDRALAACRAIGHKLHEAWIDRQQASLRRETRETVAVPARARLDITDTAVLLSDVATMLGAGHSIDLLAHRMAALLQSTSLASRVEVESESGCEYQADPTANWDAGADGTFRIRLRGSDRRVAISVVGVQSIDEISLLKSVADLVQAAVNRTADTENEDEDQNLWPRAAVNVGEDSIFRSPRMAELLKIAIRLANSDVPVLLSGETGTGKEVVARLIHDHSAVKRGPFIAFNCSNLPRELVESQLFGHRRGAFTGALDSFPGVIRAAEHGTLFLDEIGDLDPSIQPKLLRFLERTEIHPVGEARPQQVSVRIIAATNADVNHLVDQGRFRRDLLYRLDVAHVALPPLRERKDEIPALAALFLTRYARESHRANVRLDDDFIAALLLYDWPGNIRQLANEVRRVVAMAHDGETIRSGALSPDILARWNARPIAALPDVPAVAVRLDQTLAAAIEQLERAFIERALASAGGRVAEAATLLGLSRKGLFLKRRRRGLTSRQARAS